MILVELMMMTSGIAAIYYVVIWSIRNERARTIQEQTGLLRMRPPESETLPESGDASARASAGRSRRRQGASAGRRWASGPASAPAAPEAAGSTRTRRRHGR